MVAVSRMEDTAPMLPLALVMSWLALSAGSLALCGAAACGDEQRGSA
jgi:hypothetical protein